MPASEPEAQGRPQAKICEVYTCLQKATARCTKGHFTCREDQHLGSICFQCISALPQTEVLPWSTVVTDLFLLTNPATPCCNKMFSPAEQTIMTYTCRDCKAEFCGWCIEQHPNRKCRFYRCARSDMAFRLRIMSGKIGMKDDDQKQTNSDCISLQKDLGFCRAQAALMASVPKLHRYISVLPVATREKYRSELSTFMIREVLMKNEELIAYTNAQNEAIRTKFTTMEAKSRGSFEANDLLIDDDDDVLRSLKSKFPLLSVVCIDAISELLRCPFPGCQNAQCNSLVSPPRFTWYFECADCLRSSCLLCCSVLWKDSRQSVQDIRAHLRTAHSDIDAATLFLISPKELAILTADARTKSHHKKIVAEIENLLCMQVMTHDAIQYVISMIRTDYPSMLAPVMKLVDQPYIQPQTWWLPECLRPTADEEQLVAVTDGEENTDTECTDGEEALAPRSPILKASASPKKNSKKRHLNSSGSPEDPDNQSSDEHQIKKSK